MVKVTMKLGVLLVERVRYLFCSQQVETFSSFLARVAPERVMFRKTYVSAAAAHIFSVGESSDVVSIGREIRADVALSYRVSRRLFEAAICEGDMELASTWLERLSVTLPGSDRRLESAQRIYDWRIQNGATGIEERNFEFFKPQQLSQ